MKSIKPLFLLTFILIFLNSIVSAQDTDRGKTQWVDSIMSSLSLKEKIGQLMLVRANQPGKNYDPNIIKYIKDYDIGGVTFFKGGPVEQLKTTNEYQSAAKTPMLISIDAEWGLGMRLDSTISFPLQMTLGAISDNHLIEEMGLEIAKECKRMGIQFNFAPVVDINSNPKNPVIGMRSFGEDRDNVAAKGVAYMEGLQSENIISTAKHFPGHGDTDIDSHKSLPTITHDSLRMDSLELYPFKHLFNHNLSGIMIAHLYVPTYEKENNLPTTLSNNVVTKLLKEQLGFKGLVVTDGLDMQGVAKYFPAGEIEVRALEAGNDILLLPQNVPVAVQSIEKAIKEGRLSEDLINDRCRKVLSYKYDAGLNELTLQSTDNLYQDLNNSKALALRKKLFEHAITLVKNDSDLIPLKNLDDISIASISIGKNNNSFQRMLDRYSGVEKLYLPKVSNESQQKQVLRKAKKADVIIIDVQNTNINARDNFGVSKETIAFINQLRKDTKAKIILDVFAAPYVLSDINPDHFDAILMSYQEKVDAQLASAQIIFGGLPALGHLPVNVSESFKLGQGIETKKIRIAYEASNSTVLHPEYLAKVDSILLNGLKIKAYPGCQVMAMKDGAVIYNRNLGFHTANRKKAVRPDDIYDIASITKIAATTL
ncbi:MAG: glycoside hydrolase family 3 N-terminal domain-containing protein, partial [Hyphomicrobiales bacterium]